MSKPKKKAPTFDPTATAEAKQVRQKKERRGNGKGGSKPPSPEPAADLAEIEPPFECYYDTQRTCYYTKDAAGEWIKQSPEDVRRDFRYHGISGKLPENSLVSPHDLMILAIQKKRGISYAGPLAGHFTGFLEMNRRRMLITTSPNLPEPKPGAFPTIAKFLDGLFGVGMDVQGCLQKLAFELWIARGWRAIDANRRPKKPGQKTVKGHALILAGPAGCGKNLLQENLITPALGGRAVKAGDYLLGRSEFSGSLFEGESVILTDEQGGRDARSRRDFKQRIKGMVANDVQEMHHKGRDSMSVCPCQRLSISVNDEPEHLQTLPSVSDKDLADKVHLMMCYPAEVPANDGEFEEWMAAFVEEIPQWVHHCLSLVIPPELESDRPRYGTRHVHHPELLERLDSFTLWMHLWNVLLQFREAFSGKCPFESNGDEAARWLGSATKVRSTLLEAAKDTPGALREINELLRSDEVCGRLLTTLSEKEQTKAYVKALPRRGNGRCYALSLPSDEPKEVDTGPNPDEDDTSRALQ